MNRQLAKITDHLGWLRCPGQSVARQPTHGVVGPQSLHIEHKIPENDKKIHEKQSWRRHNRRPTPARYCHRHPKRHTAWGRQRSLLGYDDAAPYDTREGPKSPNSLWSLGGMATRLSTIRIRLRDPPTNRNMWSYSEVCWNRWNRTRRRLTRDGTPVPRPNFPVKTHQERCITRPRT